MAARSTGFAEGSYKPVAGVLLSELAVDTPFLEYDSPLDQLCFSPTTNNMDQQTIIESMELFGKEVLPQFDKDPIHSTTRYREAAIPKS